jgi:hypothetical protein
VSNSAGRNEKWAPKKEKFEEISKRNPETKRKKRKRTKMLTTHLEVLRSHSKAD